MSESIKTEERKLFSIKISEVRNCIQTLGLEVSLPARNNNIISKYDITCNIKPHGTNIRNIRYTIL